MTTAKKLALIAAGYALAVAGGLAAVAVNELRMPADIAETSPGMVAFGDMVLFLLATGVLGLAPTWFVLRLLADKAPRALVATELVMAALGPASWRSSTWRAAAPCRTRPRAPRSCSACSSPSAPSRASSPARSLS
jgi:hypothetical protein